MQDNQEKYNIPDVDSVIIDQETGTVEEIKKPEDFTPWEKIVAASETYGVPINDPKENCKKCWGRGYIGVEYKTNRPIACKCIYPKRTEAELLSESVTPNVRLSRSQRRKMDRYNKKLNKKGKK